MGDYVGCAIPRQFRKFGLLGPFTNQMKEQVQQRVDPDGTKHSNNGANAGLMTNAFGTLESSGVALYDRASGGPGGLGHRAMHTLGRQFTVLFIFNYNYCSNIFKI